MGFVSNVRAIFHDNHSSPDRSAQNPGGTAKYRPARHLKKRGEAARLRVLAKLNLVTLNADTGKVDLGQPVTSSANTAVGENDVPERYVPIRHLGEGGNGQVHLCRDTKIGTLVAVKTIYHNKPMSPPNEVSMLRLLGHHGNIVRCHTILDHPTLNSHVQIIFEYCPMGDLVDYLNALAGEIPELFIWHVFKHVANGLDYMHQRGFVHNDIKPGNVLLTAPREGEIFPLPKIADFGTAMVNPSHHIPQGHLGTCGYQPPEAEYCHGPEADIWALGCIVHEIALGRLPLRKIKLSEHDPQVWFDMNDKQVPPGTPFPKGYKEFCLYLASHPPSPVRIDRPSSFAPTVYSKLLNHLMMRTLDLNPRTRISTHDLQHVLPTLEALFHKLLVSGQESLLDRFDDGRSRDWARVSFVTDSRAFKQIFCVLALQANQNCNLEMLSWGTHLLNLMDPLDQVTACRYVADLGVCAPS